MRRMADAVKTGAISLQMRASPLLAHWFLLDSMRIANRANREGMRANVLALTRRCVEAISVIELRYAAILRRKPPCCVGMLTS